jgi:hypothetical protein
VVGAGIDDCSASPRFIQKTPIMKTTSYACTAALALAMAVTQAAEIQWTVHNITNDVTNVSTAGTLHDARTGRTGASNNVTVNGVTFLSVENSGNLFDSLFANDNITSRGYGNVVTDTNYRTFLQFGQRSGRFGFPATDTAPFRILPTEQWTTVNFSGLTVGNTYQIQIWYSDNGGTTQNTVLVLGDGVTTGSPVFGTDAQLFQEVANGGAGQYGIGLFVADSTTQSFNVRSRINLTTTSAWTNDGHFSNGWQIRDLGLDNSPPAPSPMTWATAPVPVTESIITMTAATATDQTGVEYQFRRYAADGTTLLFTSPWQDSPVFSDTGLTQNTTYGYTVTVRDKTPTQYTGDPSTPVLFATTPTLDTDPPNPDPMTWATVPTKIGYSAITMTATTATDTSGVEYFFEETTGNPGATDSGWQDSPTYTDTGLNPNTTYTYTVIARDKSGAQNETDPSTAESATTDPKGTATISWAAFNITNDITNISTSGTLVSARNGAISSIAVNGVTFESVANSGNLFDSLFGNDVIGARGYGSVVTDAAYATFLSLGQRSGRLGFGGAPQIEPTQVWTTVEFTNLTVGNTYQVQLWASDVVVAPDGLAQTRALVVGNGAATGPSELTDTFLFYEVADGGAGQYGIGTFVANAPNQAFNVRGRVNLNTTPAWANNDHFSNGWQLRDLGVGGPVDPAESSVVASPTSVSANGITTSTITVTVKDSEGNPLSGRTVSLQGSTGNATIETANNSTNGSGVVTFTVKSTTPGTETFTATADSVAITQTAAVNFLPVLTIVIDLGTSPAGTFIAGGTFIGTGPANLPIPTLPPGSILRSISVDAKLEATTSDNYASDLSVLLDTSAPTTGDNFALAITSSSPTANFNPAQSLTWNGGNAGVGTTLNDTKTGLQWTGDIDLATTSVFLGNAYAEGDGTWSGTITLVCDIPPASGSPFATWSGGEPFDEDKNGDGIQNGLAFLLGAPDPDVNALNLLPIPSENGSGGLTLTFNCRNADTRGTAALSVQHSANLGDGDPWLSALVPDTAGTSGPVNGVTFQVTLGDPLNTVTATIDSAEAIDGTLFGRVSGSE